MSGRRHTGDEREDLIGHIYRSVLGAAPLTECLRRLAELTNSDKAFWGCFDLRRRRGYFLNSFNAPQHSVKEYNEKYSAENIWFTRPQYFQREGLIWRGSKIVPMPELAGTQFYKCFLAPQEIYHTLHIAIDIDGDRISHVMLTRPQREPDFAESEIEIAQCFALHARRALEDQRDAAGVRMIQAGLAEVTEDAGLGVAILDPPSVIYASPTCEKILSSLGAPAIARHAYSDSRANQMLFPKAVADIIGSANGTSPTSVIMSRPEGGKVLACIKSFVFGSASAPRTGVIVTLLDLTRHVMVDQDLLRRTYELTASEARVCSLLADGHSVDDVSERLQISPNTARTHIKRIFSKTGATRQSGLVKLILNTATLQRNGRRPHPTVAARHLVPTANNSDAI